MPAGTSSVTPTLPASSVASERVNPTTPNLLAQYAVASPKTRKPSVEATVTIRPAVAWSHGGGAEEVHGDGALPVLPRHLGERRGPVHARRRDDAPQRPVGVDHPRHRS